MNEYENLSSNEQYMQDASTEHLKRISRTNGIKGTMKDFVSATGADPKTIKFDQPPAKQTEKLHARLLKDNDKGEDGSKGFCWRD
jgi:hypothetical protein